MTFTNTIKSIAAAALSVAAFALPAHASIDAIEPVEIDLVPSIVSPAGTTVAAASVEELIDRLKSMRDDGTLNEQDYRKVRAFQTASAGSVEELIDRLKSMRDDGTLNEQDYRKVRAFQTASADLDAFIDRLKARRDDGTLNEQDYRAIRKFTA